MQLFAVCRFVIEVEQVNSFQQEECLGADKFSYVENGGFLAVHVCFPVSCDDFDVKTGCRHSGA